MASPATSPDTGQLQPWYTALHHYKHRGHVFTRVIGFYPTLPAAQAAAAQSLQFHLERSIEVGLQGRYCADINLELNGLITATTPDGVEHPVSEFEIRRESTVPPLPPFTKKNEALLTDAAVPTFGFEELLVAPSMPPPNTPLSLLTAVRAVSGLPRDLASKFPEEIDPQWARSRVPLFRRRNERPLTELRLEEYRKITIHQSHESNTKRSAQMSLLQLSDAPRARPQDTPPVPLQHGRVTILKRE